MNQDLYKHDYEHEVTKSEVGYDFVHDIYLMIKEGVTGLFSKKKSKLEEKAGPQIGDDPYESIMDCKETTVEAMPENPLIENAKDYLMEGHY